MRVGAFVGSGTFRFGKRFAYACPNCNKAAGYHPSQRLLDGLIAYRRGKGVGIFELTLPPV